MCRWGAGMWAGKRSSQAAPVGIRESFDPAGAEARRYAQIARMSQRTDAIEPRRNTVEDEKTIRPIRRASSIVSFVRSGSFSDP